MKTINDEIIIQRLDQNLYVLREDLLPFSFGGNKYRIAKEIIIDLKNKGNDCLIGYGSPTSNFNRVLSLMCHNEGIPCTIISPVDSSSNDNSVNLELTKLSGAQIIRCSKDSVKENISKTIDYCKSLGMSPYYVNGNVDGSGNEKTLLKAYKDVYKKLIDYNFDYIFLATGTGMTQSGLLAGKIVYGGNTKIIGISIARGAAKEVDIIRRNLMSCLKKPINCPIIVDDNFLFGGYGIINHEIEETILSSYKQYGIPLDPIYTAKAFYGMKDYITNNNLGDKKVLFIHTGGVPLFFDYLGQQTVDNIIEIYDSNELISFVSVNSGRFNPPLDTRVNISEYVKKVLNNGHALAVKKNDTIISLAFFYCNDDINKEACLSLLATDINYTNKGYANKLISYVEGYCRERGMTKLYLYTNATNDALYFYLHNGYEECERKGERVKLVKIL